MPRTLALSGLDGSNPLAFFAALGCLAVLDRNTAAGDPTRPALAWPPGGRWLAELHGPESVEAVIDILLADLASWGEHPLLRYAYDDRGAVVAPDTPLATRDLKPRPAAMRHLFEQVACEAELGRGDGGALLCALATETGVDNAGKIKPTAFHFTAGQQAFLDMVAKLREGLRREDFAEALVGPWQRLSELPSLKWDASAPREYALRATNPAGKGERPRGVPAADWLAFQGLQFFPVLASGSNGTRVTTTAVLGGWKDSSFSWPLWTSQLTCAAIRSLIASWGAGDADLVERQARGITVAFRSRILRSDQGGYGSFTPAEPY